MLLLQSERENEGKSGYETLGAKRCRFPSVAAIRRKEGEAWVMLFWSAATSSLIPIPSAECKADHRKVSMNINSIRECLSQQDTPKAKYNSEWQGNVFLCDMGPGRWCGQIKVHYHACAATCAHPAVSIRSPCNGFGALHSKNSWKVSEQPYTSLWDVEVLLFSGERGYGLRFKAVVTQRRLFQTRQWCAAGQRYPLLWPVQR